MKTSAETVGSAEAETTYTTCSSLDELPNGTVVVGLDPWKTMRIKVSDRWIDPKKPLGTTYDVDTYATARRYGFRAAFLPTVV
ncbi:hypothetical protein AB0D08_00600 [Kitasatospora sp. NPDC048540]|uniref:hypothetical protein n=1 Tax=Kitasatospora sp. NPDC048540 TaxID=3155634 RepID=UPI0034022CA0